jgi:hypothetical protein
VKEGARESKTQHITPVPVVAMSPGESTAHGVGCDPNLQRHGDSTTPTRSDVIITNACGLRGGMRQGHQPLATPRISRATKDRTVTGTVASDCRVTVGG